MHFNSMGRRGSLGSRDSRGSEDSRSNCLYLRVCSCFLVVIPVAHTLSSANFFSLSREPPAEDGSLTKEERPV